MLALCIGRSLGEPQHFGEVNDAIADADPGREFACPVCGARLASYTDDVLKPGTSVVHLAAGDVGTVVKFVPFLHARHDLDGSVYVRYADGSVYPAGINSLAVVA